MKKKIPQTMKSVLLACFLCCMLIVNVKAQQGSRYLKETFSDNTIIKYEMKNPDLMAAVSELSDAQLNDRYARIDGVVSMSRNLQTKTFLIVLIKDKAQSLLTKEIFDFKPDEIMPLNSQQINSK